MIKNNIRNLDSMGKVMNLYYTNPELLNSIIKKNEISKVIINKDKNSMIDHDVENEDRDINNKKDEK